jgi:sec-independent protein translocase protein TatA
MGRLGLTELLIILGVALLLFGGGKIGDIGKGLGEGIRNFKRGLQDDEPPPRGPEGAPGEASEKAAPPKTIEKP